MCPRYTKISKTHRFIVRIWYAYLHIDHLCIQSHNYNDIRLQVRGCILRSYRGQVHMGSYLFKKKLERLLQSDRCEIPRIQNICEKIVRNYTIRLLHKVISLFKVRVKAF